MFSTPACETPVIWDRYLPKAAGTKVEYQLFVSRSQVKDSMFAQMTDQSLTYNAETGRYELQIDDALVTFDIELISYEEFEAAQENVRFETTA